MCNLAWNASHNWMKLNQSHCCYITYACLPYMVLYLFGYRPPFLLNLIENVTQNGCKCNDQIFFCLYTNAQCTNTHELRDKNSNQIIQNKRNNKSAKSDSLTTRWKWQWKCVVTPPQKKRFYLEQRCITTNTKCVWPSDFYYCELSQCNFYSICRCFFFILFYLSIVFSFVVF